MSKTHNERAPEDAPDQQMSHETPPVQDIQSAPNDSGNEKEQQGFESIAEEAIPTVRETGGIILTCYLNGRIDNPRGVKFLAIHDDDVPEEFRLHQDYPNAEIMLGISDNPEFEQRVQGWKRVHVLLFPIPDEE